MRNKEKRDIKIFQAFKNLNRKKELPKTVTRKLKLLI